MESHTLIGAQVCTIWGLKMLQKSFFRLSENFQQLFPGQAFTQHVPSIFGKVRSIIKSRNGQKLFSPVQFETYSLSWEK